MSLIRSRRNTKRIKRTKSIKRHNKRSRTRRQCGGDDDVDNVMKYYNMLQNYKRTVKLVNEKQGATTTYFQDRVNEWTQKLKNLPDSERIMRERGISVLDDVSLDEPKN
jgi:hypothetical protein